jgi:alpha,alpha-trehalose-phosphate synthase [UDP-forming]/trehalose-phosphatase
MRVDWSNLARSDSLGIILDLDGTLVPFAATPAEAILDEDVAVVIRALAGLPRTHVAIVSGRQRESLEDVVARLPGVAFVAEHGAWRRDGGAWQALMPPAAELVDLTTAMRALAATAPGSRIEVKRCSVCVHWRGVEPSARDAFVGAVESTADEWLESHPEFERLPGNHVLEVRHGAVHKGTAVAWLRARAPAARFIAVGDDVTDEDLFASLGPGDAGIAVGATDRLTAASARLGGQGDVAALLAWLLDARRGAPTPAPEMLVPIAAEPAPRHDLVVVSNRLPSLGGGRGKEVGGLVSALLPALHRHRGMWLGWSGQERDPGLVLSRDDTDVPARAQFDYPPGWRESFYVGFCNRSLWPLLHGFPSRVRYVDEEWHCYGEANAAYARMVGEVATADATIWVHDYQLFLVGRELRRRGHAGRLGLFIHVPFPPRDLFETLPWASELLEGMLDFDLIGFQTRRWADNFLACVRGLLDRTVEDGVVRGGGRAARVGAFPIGIDPAAFVSGAEEVDAADVARLLETLGDRSLVLGVDRLDYSKGIPERLEAFARVLELHPELRGKVSFVQVSVPSRADVPEYAELRRRVENLVGRINGLYGEADWVPVRYLYRSYDHRVLAQLYRAADVALVTPLRDGMNLVAKEYVASQDDADPGVLLLSKFAGASEDMRAAVLTNPYHREGMAADLVRALEMPLAERTSRQHELRAVVDRTAATDWAERFLGALAERPAGSRQAAPG